MSICKLKTKIIVETLASGEERYYPIKYKTLLGIPFGKENLTEEYVNFGGDFHLISYVDNLHSAMGTVDRYWEKVVGELEKKRRGKVVKTRSIKYP